MGVKDTPPKPPDYEAAAQATAQGNIATAVLAQYGNMTNQYTPQGSVTYTPNTVGYISTEGERLSPEQYATLGEDVRSKYNPLLQWNQNVTLSPEQQAMYDQNQQINQSLGDVAQQGLGYVQSALNKPLSFDSAYGIQTPGQIQQEASDAAYNNATRYLDPQFERQQAGLENQLANQGITRGSEAWNNAMQEQGRAKEQAYGQARNQAYLQGLQGAGQAYNQSMGTRQQQISELQALQQNPLNMLNAVRTGQQMQVASQPQVGVSGPGSMATVAGPDMLGAAQAQYQGQMGAYNAQQAQQNALTSGLFGLAGAGLGAYGMSAMAPAAVASDARIKENVVKIGKLDNGLNLYSFEYKPEYKDREGHGRYVGVMAQEAEKVRPDAVIDGPNGYKMVDYRVIYG